MGQNLRLYNEGRLVTKEVRAAVEAFDAANVTEQTTYEGKDGTKRFIHDIRWPKKCLNSKSSIETVKVITDEADPSVVIEEVREYETPNAVSDSKDIEVFYDCGGAIQCCTGAEFLAWYAPTGNEQPVVFVPDTTEAKSLMGATKRTDEASQAALNDKVNKKEAADKAKGGK